MKPQYLSLAQIFSQTVRYVVPLFQRPYVWTEDLQWEPLWEDVEAVAERRLNASPHAEIRGHFLGTAVLEQKNNHIGSVERRNVIDGQQRLTTLQILLKAAAHGLAHAHQLAESEGRTQDLHALHVAFMQLDDLTVNPKWATGEEAFKVWPTNEDRAPFRAVMTADGSAPLDTDGLIPQAYAFFLGKVQDWLKPEPVGPRATALAEALMRHLRMIVLDLEEADEPQAIFETLNTGGAPLLPADLIKNWLLWEAARTTPEEAAITALYDRYWRVFDSDAEYWRTRVGTGHAARPRIDGFLATWLTEKNRATVPPGRIYDEFRNLVGNQNGACDAPALMAELHRAANLYRGLEQPPPPADLWGTFLHRLKALDVVVVYPVLLHLLQRPGSDALDRNRIAALLESFLVRRIVCGLNTRGYGMFFINLLAAIAKVGPDGPATPAVIAQLRAGHSATTRWPDDTEFATAWQTGRSYETMGKRLPLILRALEEKAWKSNKLALPVAQFDWPRMQIEHVMPQSWQKTWPLPHHGDAAARDTAVQNIGNLAFVSTPLNPSMSNGAWATKREALQTHASQLYLNQSVLKADTWDEAAIAARARELFELARSIWPGPA